MRWKFPLRSHQVIKMIHNAILFSQIPEMMCFGILLSLCLCVWWEISLLFLLIPHLSSFIFTPPPLLLQMSRASWRSTFLRSCLSVYRNVPLCPRSAIAGTPTRWEWDTLKREICVTVRWTQCLFVLVTHLQQAQLHKHKGILSLRDPKTVTQGNK